MIIPTDVVRYVTSGMREGAARMSIHCFGGDRQNPCLVILANPGAMAYWADAFGEAGIQFKSLAEQAEKNGDAAKAADYRDKKEAVLAFFTQIQQAILGGNHIPS